VHTSKHNIAGGHPEGVGYTNYKPFVGCIISLSINDLDIPMMMIL